MVAVRNGLAASLAALVVVLATLGAAAGVGPVGWTAGLLCAAAGAVTVARVASSAGARVLGPADLVTLVRATLACGVAALVAEAFVRDAAVGVLVGLASVALALDGVDGPVARRTGTASRFGARLDGEADAFLILVLSVHVARSAGAWVLALGAARYLFAAAGWVLPWMRAQLPARYWRKVVTACVGLALVLAAADLTPAPVTAAALLVALGLLAESFGRDVRWLWRHRRLPRTARDARHPDARVSPP